MQAKSRKNTLGCRKMKFKEDRPFATPDAAERKLLELANAMEADHAARLSVGVINKQFRDAGGSYEDYRAALAAAISNGWLIMHPSGGYLSFTQAGADLYLPDQESRSLVSERRPAG
jgi:hypothetical protein